MDDLSTYGLHERTLARATGVSLTTARRWTKAGTIPERYADLARLKLRGDLGIISEAWSGFALTRNVIWTPEGTEIRPGDLRAIQYRRQQLRELERQLAEPQQRSLF